MKGRGIWKEFRESQTDFLKAQAFIPEAVRLFAEAGVCMDAGTYLAVAILCRASLESAFLEFLSIQWQGNNFFNIVYPTKLDGKPRRVEFEELENGIKQKVDFSEEQVKAISRIQEDGNFVAHSASRKVKERFRLSKDVEKWEASNKEVNGLERVKAVTKLYSSQRHWVTGDEAISDLQDTLSIILTLCKAMETDLGRGDASQGS